MNHGNWKPGKPIPKKYRNKLYEWEGGGYDGCWWEMNQGLVTEEGHWNPFHSTGRNGLDRDDEYNAEIRRLKEKHGFGGGRYGRGEDVEAWYAGVRYRAHEEAMRKFYGERPYDNPEYYDPKETLGKGVFPKLHEAEVDAFVRDRTANETARYNAYKADRRELDLRHAALLDEVFMDQVKAQAERGPDVDAWNYHGPARDQWRVYDLDEAHVKKSCAEFCENYSRTVGVMTAVLDHLAEAGYDVWCTCSDCGEQFQLSDHEKFQHLVDEGAYHGDGGIGCIFTRVQCEECREHTTCPNCGKPNMPKRSDEESGHAYDHYAFRERFVAEWLGVCQYCADGFFYEDSYRHWRDELDDLESEIDGLEEQRRKYLEIMERQNPERHPVFVVSTKMEVEKAKNDLVNAMRDRMQSDVEKYFSDCNDWAGNRLR